jgi:hypothetical protein
MYKDVTQPHVTHSVYHLAPSHPQDTVPEHEPMQFHCPPLPALFRKVTFRSIRSLPPTLTLRLNQTPLSIITLVFHIWQISPLPRPSPTQLISLDVITPAISICLLQRK